MNQEDLNKFSENYEVRVLNDQKRRARTRNPMFFTDPLRANVIEENLAFETERVYTLEVPESRLKTLVEMEKRFFRNQLHNKQHVDMFELLMEKEREEAYHRETNQAVKKAYEQYSIMLNLAGYQRKI